jgi:hypothetical protein
LVKRRTWAADRFVPTKEWLAMMVFMPPESSPKAAHHHLIASTRENQLLEFASPGIGLASDSGA